MSISNQTRKSFACETLRLRRVAASNFFHSATVCSSTEEFLLYRKSGGISYTAKRRSTCETPASNKAAKAAASSLCGHESKRSIFYRMGRMFYSIKKADLYLLAGCLLVALLSFFLYKMYYHEDGGTVVVTVDGAVCKQLPLDQNAAYAIPGSEDNSPNVITIQDGFVSMTEAYCPDKLCMHQKKINKKGETIICLPRKIVISIDSTDKNEVDGVAY